MQNNGHEFEKKLIASNWERKLNETIYFEAI